MPETLRTILMRHKAALSDASVFSVVMALGGVTFFLFDLDGHLSADPRIDFHELLILAVILGFGITWYGWRRIVEQEGELGRTTAAESRARFLAHHDPLTGLPNRRRLQEALDAALAHPAAAERTHALLVLDLNGFKAINDIHGHARGDAVLAVVAARLAKTLRHDDLLARTGGDEFALVARDVEGVEGAAQVAARLLEALAPPIVIEKDAHHVGTGVGIALVPADGGSAGDILRKADVALYRAKADGTAGYAVFHEDMDREVRERERLMRDLAAAVEAQAIVPFYQPIVDLDTGEIRAFEALARWTHPADGPIPPDRFIPLAEESGLIRPLADQILQRACTDALLWPSHIGLAVNVSPVQLRDKTFGLRLLRIVAASGLPPHRLELEITESAIARDLEAARASLEPLRDAGLRIVLDDFGTGATSLAHLRSLKFDGLKIDRRFIDLMAEEAESAAIVKAIIGLATGLGLTIVAEGVEQLAQSAALRAEGCRTGQGFYFGRAMSAEDAAALFAAPERASA